MLHVASTNSNFISSLVFDCVDGWTTYVLWTLQKIYFQLTHSRNSLYIIIDNDSKVSTITNLFVK